MRGSTDWRERCQRLAGMEWDELSVRTGQEFQKRWDLVLSRLGIPVVNDDASALGQFSESFFFKSAQLSEILDTLRERRPEVVDEIVSRAERVYRHHFDLLGYEGIDYGPDIDWHADTVHGKRAPLLPWFKIPYLDFDQVGDSKIIWELSRHQHLMTLAKAYRFTGKSKYAQELFRQWYHWQERNPYPLGINWASSLEVAFRTFSWLWVWYLLKGCSIVPKQFSVDLRRALMVNGRHIERFLSTYFAPNTHLLGEGVGLFFIGTSLYGSRSAKRWQELGRTIVLREAQRQTRLDGMHFEQSIYYHVYALDFFLHFRILASQNGIIIPAAFDETIERMLDVLGALGRGGRLPQFGDDDGGRVFDGTRNQGEHMLDPLSTGAVLFGRSDFKTVAGAIREETLWLCGTAGLKRFDELTRQPQLPNSFALPSSGIYSMCASLHVPVQLAIDAGPHGTGLSGHGHADALSVQLTIDQEQVLIDPGTFVYVDEVERNRFRETSAHNSVQVDGLSQAQPLGPFKWCSLPNVAVERWITDRTFDLFVGSHDGYSRLAEPVRHRRYVYFLKSQFWLIQDVLEGQGVHELDLFWHFARGSLSPISGGVMFLSERKTALALLLAASQDVSRVTLEDWSSTAYGKKQPSSTLRVSARAQLPVCFASLVVPLEDGAASIGNFQPFVSKHRGASVRSYRYSLRDGLTHYMFFADAPGNWQLGYWSSDARFLHCSMRPGNRLEQFVLCDGTHLEIAGRPLFSAETAVPVAKFFSEECGHSASSSGELAVVCPCANYDLGTESVASV